MRVVCAIIIVRMAIATRIDNFPRSQNRATILPFPVALSRTRSSGRELFAHIVRQTQATTCASVAIRTTDTRRLVDIGCSLL